MGKKRPKPRTTKQTESLKETAANDSIGDMIAAALSCQQQTVFMKVCRLCESKDGPFINIFDADTATYKKIDEIMPFVVSENDGMPHKICFRCSAKVEELNEFVKKCVKTQENLRDKYSKKTPLHFKTKTRMLWEKKLNMTNMSNDDICNALIPKAMEGLKDIPLNPLPMKEECPPLSKNCKVNARIEMNEKPYIIDQSDDEHDDVSLKQVKLTIEKCDEKPTARTSRSNKLEGLVEGLPDPVKKIRQYPARKIQGKVEDTPVSKSSTSNKTNNDTNAGDKQISNPPVSIQKKAEDSNNDAPSKPQDQPTINIMDHVSIIKVHDVGTLFLCKLCNRNFLKKDVVYSHGCAKNNVPKDNLAQSKTVTPPQVQKPSTVKYIKIDRDFNKPMVNNKVVENKQTHPDAVKVNIPVQPEAKPKPKVGPASKVNRIRDNQEQSSIEPAPPPRVNAASDNKAQLTITPSVNFPGMPGLNTRFKLVPGPNNMYTLIEDKQSDNKTPQDVIVPTDIKDKKRKAPTAIDNMGQRTKYQLPVHSGKPSNPEVFDIEDDDPPPQPVAEKPYPVGLFQTVPHHSGVFTPTSTPPSFSSVAMKKQSYTVVQTGNPSKLLISAKPQPDREEPSRKKRKSNNIEKKSLENNVSINDTGPSKEAGFFTFINVDPLLQPSYVLPTDNIQESQITTSSSASKSILDNKDKEKYECNMCNEKFSREKKLLSHIQSHYKQMDEEDQLRAEKELSNKRKTRRS